ncbi:hypothetical protein P8452_20896 [Trifolium repens]|nr:hypothetical protein P8452_20896 [Trifolium repens]
MPEQTQRRKEGSDSQVEEGVSFKSLLLRRKEGGEVEESGGVKKSFRLKSMEDLAPLELQTFADRLNMEKHHEVKATHMGGNMVLIHSPCDGELPEMMRCNKEWWDHCFYKVIPWKPNLVSESREIWIQIFGLPLHAWEESSFKMVAGRFGVFLDFDEATIEKQRLDVARVKLRTVRRCLIDTVIQLSVLGSKFDVWVVEERCNCSSEVKEEATIGSGRTLSNSDEEVWHGDDGDLFFDGKTDSDRSDSYQQLLDLEKNGRKKSIEVTELAAVIATTKGERVTVCHTQPLVEVIVREGMSDSQSLGGQVEAQKDDCTQVSSNVDKRETLEVRGFVCGVGPDPVPCEKGGGDVSVGGERRVDNPFVMEGNDQVVLCGDNRWNPFVDPVDEGERNMGRPMCEEAQHDYHVPTACEEEGVGVTKCGGVYGVVVSNAREEEGVELRKNGGAHGVVVYSDVSGSSQSTSTGDCFQFQISSRNLDRVRKLKSAMTRLTARVQKVRDELEQLLDDDDDMADLYLSRKAGSASPVSGSGAANWFAGSPTIGSKISRASIATVRLDENDVEELEMLLELLEYIDNTEDYINIQVSVVIVPGMYITEHVD